MEYNENACKFFNSFAGLEFKMVAKGIAVVRGNGFLERPDWDNLFERLDPDAVKKFNRKYRRVALDDPPKSLKYVSQECKFEWHLNPAHEFVGCKFLELSQEVQFGHITEALRRVRNNLFHGAKKGDSSKWTDSRLDQCSPMVEEIISMLDHVLWKEPRIDRPRADRVNSPS